MAEERDLSHDPVTGRDGDPVDISHATATPGIAPSYPGSEADYWRASYADEPYYESGRSFDDYAPAYEMGWVSHASYGDDFDAADRVLANDWEIRKGRSPLSWEQARAATRAAWQRAHNARTYVSDGSASADTVIATLNDLLENARDGELGFREAADHTQSPQLAALFGRRAQACGRAAEDLRQHIERLGGKADAGGSVSGAAHRVWVQIRGMFAGAKDQAMLAECERGEDTALARYRKALEQNLPQEIHALIARQFEGAQRNHDMIRSLRDRPS